MEELGPIFYNIILPALLTFGFGYLLWYLQRRGGTTTVDEFQKLFNEVQEERDNLKNDIAKLDDYKAECNKKIDEYRNQVSVVMESEMEKRRKLEVRLEHVEQEKESYRLENVSLKNLVNNLTEKLFLAQEQLQVAQERISVMEKQLVRVNDDIRAVKKQTGELKFPKDNDETR